MPYGVGRVGDSDSAGATQVVGSTNVFANKLPVCRAGDIDTGAGPPNPPGAALGNPTVFVNNLPIAAVGIPDTQGRPLVLGSTNVFVGP